MSDNSNAWKAYSSKYSNTSSEIKSHSSVLFNERVNALFIMLDTEATDLEISPDIKKIIKTKSILNTIWRNIRPIVANNPNILNILSLRTEHPGLYTVDVGFAHIQECINYMFLNEQYSYENLIYTIQQTQLVEGIIREILQYYSYFVRTEYKQKPDINIATEKYKEMADQKTMEEFNELLGDKSKIQSSALEVPITDDFFNDMSDNLEESEEFNENSLENEEEEEKNE